MGLRVILGIKSRARALYFNLLFFLHTYSYTPTTQLATNSINQKSSAKTLVKTNQFVSECIF